MSPLFWVILLCSSPLLLVVYLYLINPESE
jgi:hypothetical protein